MCVHDIFACHRADLKSDCFESNADAFSHYPDTHFRSAPRKRKKRKRQLPLILDKGCRQFTR